MTHPTGWPTAQSICDIPEVRELIDAFAEDSNEENMLAMVSAIMTHSPASVRAAALEEERIDWIANANCPGGVAYPFNVKCAIRQAIAEADTALSVASIYTLADQQLAQRIEEWIGKHGGENTATLLLYEAMKALKKPSVAAATSGRDIDAAAKQLAESLDYPWEHMPEEGRNNMRAVITTALSAAPAGGLVDPIIATWPAEIWLNAGDDPLAPFDEYSDVTWCSTPQGEHDVRYVRAPIVTAPAGGLGEVSSAARDVLAERQRQQDVEGWTPEHDDQHDDSELAIAASCYAMCTAAPTLWAKRAPLSWPWPDQWWKPAKDPRRNLEKAGALILAEIDRLDRIAAAQGEGK